MPALEGETLPRWKGIPGGDGTGPEVADVVQVLHMITMSRIIGGLPRSLVEPAPSGLVYVPVADPPPSRLVLACNEQDRRPLVVSFVAAALRPRGYETGFGVGGSEVLAGSGDERAELGKGAIRRPSVRVLPIVLITLVVPISRGVWCSTG
ncbi:type 2 periplasmic-binding domain-containing protein [Streptomyces rimosus]|uniref:hypothetical protein n=1 Tax=Streptomyces rimosus TaxID=1927 RepID=UPI000AB5069C|nr:hypothetical protein [Streptomyces rimosus]